MHILCKKLIWKASCYKKVIWNQFKHFSWQLLNTSCQWDFYSVPVCCTNFTFTTFNYHTCHWLNSIKLLRLVWFVLSVIDSCSYVTVKRLVCDQAAILGAVKVRLAIRRPFCVSFGIHHFYSKDTRPPFSGLFWIY